jgi:hypothetical protein
MNMKILFCDTCGCAVSNAEAIVRGWGSLLGKSQCSRQCAEVLYTPDFVQAHWVRVLRKLKSPQLRGARAAWETYFRDRDGVRSKELLDKYRQAWVSSMRYRFVHAPQKRET